MLDQRDIQAILTLIGRASLTGAEALTVVRLQEKLTKMTMTNPEAVQGAGEENVETPEEETETSEETSEGEA